MWCCCLGPDRSDYDVAAAGRRGAPVNVHVYHVTGEERRFMKGANKIMHLLGTGAYHAGVEVYGQEWSFGYSDYGTGIMRYIPQCCSPHRYYKSIEMGVTFLKPHDVLHLIHSMAQQWIGQDYDLLRQNCCDFSDALCVELGVGHLPTWVMSLADVGANLADSAGYMKRGKVLKGAKRLMGLQVPQSIGPRDFALEMRHEGFPGASAMHLSPPLAASPPNAAFHCDAGGHPAQGGARLQPCPWQPYPAPEMQSCGHGRHRF
eukprot:TRINITY_DN38172_c0_g1_i1.p1 TRINITY_DN38172_c0_g1~~TRINITY_DN38172_c0_g1_i1.p1  ORF type:complete len:261 (+),score=18.45 TRINITY_DN38172_c0_g1_i1:97-879(+)